MEILDNSALSYPIGKMGHLYFFKNKLNFSFNFERVYKRSTRDIVNGAFKGLVMLQETY